jgi:hypothetical protein
MTAVKRSTGRVRDAKVPTNEALRAVRRFGDDLHDIPVSAYLRRRAVVAQVAAASIAARHMALDLHAILAPVSTLIVGPRPCLS